MLVFYLFVLNIKYSEIYLHILLKMKSNLEVMDTAPKLVQPLFKFAGKILGMKKPRKKEGRIVEAQLL